MKIKMICIAAVLSAAAITDASAGGLLGGGHKRGGGIGNGSIVIAPKIGILNGSDTRLLSGLLNSNSLLRGGLLSSNDNGGLLGLGILSGSNNDRSHRRGRR